MLYKLYRYVHACMMVRRVKHNKYRWWIGWICTEGFDRDSMIENTEKHPDYPRAFVSETPKSATDSQPGGVELLYTPNVTEKKIGQICLDIWDWTILDLSKVSKAFDIFWSWSSWQLISTVSCVPVTCNGTHLPGGHDGSMDWSVG